MKDITRPSVKSVTISVFVGALMVARVVQFELPPFEDTLHGNYQMAHHGDLPVSANSTWTSSHDNEPHDET